jgi:ribose transport system substrate-binding protein
MNIPGSTALRRILILCLCLALGVGIAACGGGSSSTSGGSTASEEPAEETGTEAPAAEAEAEAEGEAEAEPEGETETASAEGEYGQLQIGELNFDMSKYCGEKPTVVGAIDGFGGNTWRVETRALIEKTAKECPNVTEVKYFDANLDPEKFNSTVSAWAAQGVNIIVAFDDFGQSAVPAFKAAQLAGVKVVTDNAIPGNAQIPGDVTAAVIPDFEKGGKEWVEFLNEATKEKGQIALIGGPAGNQFDTPSQEAMEKAIEETGAGVEFVESEPVVANWELAKTQQVTAALLNKYPDLNGVVLTAMFAAPAVNRAFEAAGKPLPAIAGQSSSNEVICEIHEKQQKEPNYNVFSLDGSAQQAALALAKGMAAYQEIEAPELGPTDEPTKANYKVYIDTLKDMLPACEKSLPGGADLSTALTKSEIEEVVK